ncbi:MAG TPA: hypothetical protein DCR14_00105, partial [Acidimicrobiaceae bacterium]|nr:hypothetical protein [Acidimicrobiaceae bacterium]
KLLRLDHVMGLMRQWWVPRGLPATDGCYVRYPLEELMAVAVLEAHLAGAVVVGENLGTVPPEVNEQMHQHGMLGISVALDCLPTWGTNDVHVAGRGTMSMVSTHDSYPFAGWWQGGDVHMMRRLLLITDDEVPALLQRRAEVRDRVVGHLVWTGRLHSHDAPLREVMAGVADEVASQPADITVFNLEDLWLEDRPQNVPGTFQEEPNWRRPAARSIDDVAADPALTAVAKRISARRHESATQSPPS